MATLALCVVIAGASGSFYYSGFAILLIAVATVLRALVTRRWLPLLTGAVLLATILFVSFASLAPTLAYHLEHGSNPAKVGQRGPFESEYYSLRLTQLILPLGDHRFGPFASARDAYEGWTKSTGIPSTEAALATLGTLGAIGFLGLLLVLLVSAVGGERTRASPLARATAVASLMCFMVATMGGFSSLIAFGFPGLRAWNRLAIFIAFFSLLGVGLLLDRVGRRLSRRRLGTAAFGGLLASLLFLGFLDQTYRSMVPPYGELSSQYRNDQNFARAMEARLQLGAAVYELPYADFPEGTAPGKTLDYDLVRPYLHSHDLRWSFGAMRGRPADWASRLADRRLTKVLPAISAAGFAGIYLDRLGYQDHGAKAVRKLRQLLGVQPLTSEDNRFVFFDLRPYNARLRQTTTQQELADIRAATLGA
jgi:phosphoglycerol transferase